ncbi:MAG: outer membrane protein transport protein, partial [Acidobacteriota bacterium]|nr:outer membrane protein transport protein [Acidobacteriota bacterium]
WGLKAACILILILAMVAWPAAAQTDDEAGAGVTFNFSTPGARSLGMGGAFLGSVDDASAAYSNPAGLLQLSESEALIEGSRWRYSTPFSLRGRAAGQPTGLGVDTLGSIETGQAESELSGFSYAAAVYPREDWAAAVFMHQVARFESSFETEGVFGLTGRLRPVRARYSLDIRQFGVAFAKEWQNGVAAGLSLSGYSLKLDSLTQRYTTLPFYYGTPSFSLGRAINFQAQSADGQELGVIFGLRWDRSDKLSVGMVYRVAPQFDLSVRSESLSPDFPPSQRVVLDDAVGVFDIPDVAGLGISYRFSPQATINFDLNRVYYSQLSREIFLFLDENEDQPVTAEDYALDDVLQVHLGGEYVFADWRLPLAVRAGAWLDPDHRLHADKGSALNQARLPEGETLVHGSLGVGLLFGSRVQVDAAVDFSKQSDTASVSAVVRF